MIDVKSLGGQTFLFLGRAGAGKGTQAGFLVKWLKDNGCDVIYIYTGQIGRKLARTNSLIGKWTKRMLDNGDFFPDWMPTCLWFSVLNKKLVDKDQVVVFDGTPRKLAEALVVDELMKYLNRPQPRPIYLDITETEARQRLLARNREDDTRPAIAMRLRNFESDVIPILQMYGRRLIAIDAAGSREDVFERLTRKIES